MADEAAEKAANEGAATQPVKMQILGQYVRDMSFENVVAQKGMTGEITPEVSVQVGLEVKKRPADHQFEVATKYTVKSNNKGTEDTLFLLELEYVGIFHVENIPQEQLHPFLLIECPRMTFPFARRIVSDVVRDGGFPPVNLDTIDWVALFRENVARQAASTNNEQVN